MLSAPADSELTVLAFVSGKGGVGKTMLAVSAARELSATTSTLVLDLDYFNRGLSGLLKHGKRRSTVDAPTFLDAHNKAKWFIREVASNLYTVSFPDISEQSMLKLLDLPVQDLAIQLHQWIIYVASITESQVVILDCHGGPDQLSFAASYLAHEVLLVSEPDRVTMYGTLHFMRKLSELSISPAHVHLVFNKVLDSFSTRFLTRTYNQQLRPFFDEKPLLAAFPLEIKLMKHSEHYPFVTEDYPKSMLARKTQVLLRDLLGHSKPYLLSARARSVPRLVTLYWRKSFARRPKLLQLDTVMVLSFVVLLALICGFVLEKFLRRDTLLDSLLPVTIIGIAMWAALVTLLSWTGRLDDELIKVSRRRRWLSFSMHAITLTALWLATSGLITYLLLNLGPVDPELAKLKYLWYIALAVVGGFWLGIIVGAIRDICYTRQKAGPVCRIVLGLFVLASGTALALGRDLVGEIFVEDVEVKPVAFRELDPDQDAKAVELIRRNEEVMRSQAEGEVGWFTFLADRAGVYVISSESYDEDPVMALYGTDGERYLEENDDGGGSLNARIERVLETGEYYVAVREYLGRPMTYVLRLRNVPAERESGE